MQTTLVNPCQVLSDENKTKVCLITDINKAGLLLIGRNITANEFDVLYGESIEVLEATLSRIQQAIHFRQNMQELAQVLFSIQRRPGTEEDGN